jgi:ribosomal protein S18 acetylase RimI-like enzyme
MRIREADGQDIGPILDVVARANATYSDWAGKDWMPPDSHEDRPYWNRSLLDPDTRVGVAEEDAIVGCISCCRPNVEGGSAAHLSRLFVDPSTWRRGAGTALLDWACGEMSAFGCTRATLFAAAANVGARRFYERHGWRKSSGGSEWHGLQLVEYTIHLR